MSFSGSRLFGAPTLGDVDTMSKAVSIVISIALLACAEWTARVLKQRGLLPVQNRPAQVRSMASNATPSTVTARPQSGVVASQVKPSRLIFIR